MKIFGIGGDGQREGGSPPTSLGTHPYLLLDFGKPQGFEFPALLPGEKHTLPPFANPTSRTWSVLFLQPPTAPGEGRSWWGKLEVGVYRVIHPISSMSGSNPMLLPAWWCSPQSPHFPSPVQHKDFGNLVPDCSGLFPWLSQRQQAQCGGLTAQAQKWVEPGQPYVWGFSQRRNRPSEETIGHKGSSAFKARAGIRPGVLLTRSWVLPPIPCPRVLPPATTLACSP